MVSFFLCQGRRIAQLIRRGRSGSTITAVPSTGLVRPSRVPAPSGGLGSPKLGAGTIGPAGFQSPNHLVTCASSALGSASPATITTVLSGRYQRSWNARTLSAVAARSVASVPIGGRLASGWPWYKVWRVRSPTRWPSPACSRFSASTIGTSVPTPRGVKIGAVIMPDSSLKVSSSLGGAASGRSSLNTVCVGLVSALVSVPKVAPSRCQRGIASPSLRYFDSRKLRCSSKCA